MISPVRLFCRALLLLWAAALTGCWPSAHSRLDEEKEPHFLAGKSRVNEMDYAGAIESFEKALEVNPRSSASQFELGLLYEKNKQDYAIAIYHFERFLELRPKADNASLVQQRILACKQELAKTVSFGPVTQSLQAELERLTEENKRLREEMEALRAYYSRAANPPAVLASARSTPLSSPNIPARLPAGAVSGPATRLNSAVSEATATPRRTHTIQTGETPTGIARRYGIKLDALMAANPSLDARRLQVGRTLNVPSS